MCKVVSGSLTVVLAVVLAAFAPAQEKNARVPSPAQIMERLRAADTNGDGVLSKDEAPGPLKEEFDKIDANGDGQLDPEELKPVVAGLVKRAAPVLTQILEHVKAIDADGDGKLSLEEVMADAKRRFAKVDANGDGKLEAQELKPVLAAAAAQFPTLATTLPQELKDTDANGDRVLTVDEVTQKHKKDFARADGNGDGKIDSDELKRAVAKLLNPAATLPARIMKRFKAADANGDGKLSEDEAPEPFKRKFARLDANGDGSIDLDELKRALAARADKSQ